MIYFSDSCNRADGAVDGTAPDNAAGGTESNVYSKVLGGVDFSIVSNRCINTDVTGVHAVAVTGTAATGDYEFVGVSYGVGGGIGFRYHYSSGEQLYFYYRDTSSSVLYLEDHGAFIQLDTSGPAITDGDTVAIGGVGQNLYCKLNGAVVITKADTTIASGIPVMYSGGNNAGFDNLLCQTVPSGAVADRLIIATQPVGNQPGVAFTTQPVVNVADSSSATVTTDTSTVSVALIGVTGTGTLGGTATKAAVAGSAAFSGLSVTPSVPGSFKLRFTDGSLTLADSAVFYVGATQLAITSVSTPTHSGHATTVVVTAKDANGVAVGNYTGTVTLTLNKLSGAGSVATMVGTSIVAAVGGVSTHTPIATTTDNGLVATSFTYTARATGLSDATTATITPTIEERVDVTIT